MISRNRSTNVPTRSDPSHRRSAPIAPLLWTCCWSLLIAGASGCGESGPSDADAAVGADAALDASTDASVADAATSSLSLSPSAIDFGPHLEGFVPEPVHVVVTNQGSVATGPIALATSGANADVLYGYDDSCEGATLAVGASCELWVEFFPEGSGAKHADVTVSAEPGGAAVLPLAGFVVRHARLSSASLGHDFGVVPMGEASAEHVIHVQNAGDQDAEGLTISWTGDTSDFVVSSSTCGAVLEAGAACAIGVRFVPAFPGPSSARLRLESDPGGRLDFDFDGLGHTTTTHAPAVTLEGLDGAGGHVSTTTLPAPAMEIDCGSHCTEGMMRGSEITLEAHPAEGYFFGGFSGACVSSTPTCTFTLAGDAEVTATFTPANYVFTTQNTYTLAELKAHATDTSSERAKTLSGADAICRAAAGSNDVHAWLGSGEGAPGRRLPNGVHGFVRMDERAFLTHPTAESPVYYLPSLDETGIAIAGTPLVWSGMDLNDFGASPTSTCGDWVGTGTMVVGSVSDVRWAMFARVPCDPATSLHLLCFEGRFGAHVVPPPPPEDARRIFASSGLIPSQRSVIPRADSICAADALAAGLPGTYRALLATSSTSIASRVDPRPAPIHRPDGVRVAAGVDSLFDGAPLFAPIAVDAFGRRVGSLVWTGSPTADLPGSPADTCYDAARGDWESDHTGTGRRGDPLAIGSWLDAETASCGLVGRVYCLEQ